MPKGRGRNGKKGRKAGSSNQSATATPNAFYKTERKRDMGNAVLAPGRVLGGFPEKMKTTLRYVSNLTLTSTSGVPTTYSFRGNSVYDPDASGTGAQPANYDDFVIHYDYYRVLSSRFTIIACHGSNSNTPGQLALVPAYTSPTSTPIDYAANPFALLGVVSNTSNPLTLSGEMATSRILGMTRAQVMARDECGSLVSTNPVDQWYWRLCWQAVDNATTLIAQCTLTIEYEVEFNERIAGNLDLVGERIEKLKAAKEHRLYSKTKSLDDWSDVGDEKATHVDAQATPRQKFFDDRKLVVKSKSLK